MNIHEKKFLVLTIIPCLLIFLNGTVFPDDSLNLTPTEQKYLLALARHSIKAHLKGEKPDYTIGGKDSFPFDHRLFTARNGVFVTLDKWIRMPGDAGPGDIISFLSKQKAPPFQPTRMSVVPDYAPFSS